MLTITWQSLLLGALVGAVCILGLAWGLKILLDNVPEGDTDKPLPQGKLIFAACLLGGQLLGALAILYFTRRVINAPIGTALGLLGSITIGSLFLKNIRAKK